LPPKPESNYHAAIITKTAREVKPIRNTHTPPVAYGKPPLFVGKSVARTERIFPTMKAHKTFHLESKTDANRYGYVDMQEGTCIRLLLLRK